MVPSDFSVEVLVLDLLEEDERQTNNEAELVASVKALRLFESRSCKVYVITNSR